MSNEGLAQQILAKKSKILFLTFLVSFISVFLLLKKQANRSFLLISSYLVSDVSELLISLKSNERCERMAQFAQQK